MMLMLRKVDARRSIGLTEAAEGEGGARGWGSGPGC